MDNWGHMDGGAHRPMALDDQDNPQPIVRQWPSPETEAAYWMSRRAQARSHPLTTNQYTLTNQGRAAIRMRAIEPDTKPGGAPSMHLRDVPTRKIESNSSPETMYIFDIQNHKIFDPQNMKNVHRNWQTPFYIPLDEYICSYAPVDFRILLHGRVWFPHSEYVNRLFNVSAYMRDKLRLALLDRCHDFQFDFNENCLPHPNYIYVLSGEATWETLFLDDSK